MQQFDRQKIHRFPLQTRISKSSIDKIAILPDSPCPDISQELDTKLQQIAQKIIQAKKNKKSIVLTYGAHLIKNGLGPLLASMIENQWITHLATNGAGTIHDWEFAFQGKTEEDVRNYLSQGQFGIWEETTAYMNLAILLSAAQGEGYGEAIGKMISQDGLNFSIAENLEKQLSLNTKNAVGIYNLLQTMKQYQIQPKKINILHPWKKYSLCFSAYKNNVPLTVHPGFGYDIIYTHHYSNGAAIGITAEIDFLRYVQALTNLENGVFLSIGSAIMSPMIFEKGLSMARNVAHQQNKIIENFSLIINDIQEGEWNWGSEKEPPKNDPAYFLRFCKSFDRAHAKEMKYICLDNRLFLQTLYKHLQKEDPLPQI